jgi:hypothetical protein
MIRSWTAWPTTARTTSTCAADIPRYTAVKEANRALTAAVSALASLMTLPSFWELHCQSADRGGSRTAQNVASAARGGIGYDRGTGEAGRRDPDEEALMASIRVVVPAAWLF